jgi:hypothetical protein
LLCGIIGSNNFNLDTYVTNCNKVLADGSTLSGIYQLAFMESQSAYIPYSELRSAALKAGDEYTFWYVAPRTAEDGSLYIETREIVTEVYKHSSADLKATATSFFDVDVKFEVKGSEGYMLGYTKASEFDAAALATYYTDNYDYLNAVREDVTYTGSFLELMETSEKLDNGTEYVVYYIAKNKNRVILEDNILYWSFTTADFVDGGDIEVAIVGEPVIEYKDIYLDLNSNGEHIMLIYNAIILHRYALRKATVCAIELTAVKAIHNVVWYLQQPTWQPPLHTQHIEAHDAVYRLSILLVILPNTLIALHATSFNRGEGR